jgi:hypothetical protein
LVDFSKKSRYSEDFECLFWRPKNIVVFYLRKRGCRFARAAKSHRKSSEYLEKVAKSAFVDAGLLLNYAAAWEVAL